jgi:hypothetical protein
MLPLDYGGRLYVLWHADLLPGNDHEIANIQQLLLSNGFRNENVSMKTIGYTNCVPCVVHAKMLQAEESAK